MLLKQFLQLVRDKEKFNVDFKISCEAFSSKFKAPKGELAKDICAMANNGNIASYILIGVSDDGKSFKSVANLNLTDDRLQSFCRTAINPSPAVALTRLQWSSAPREISAKVFVVIKVGPNPKLAFRLGDDYITYGEKLCLRRNEVWVRRGATTDLATPEEIARLVKGRSFNEAQKVQNNRLYDRLSAVEKRSTILADLSEALNEIGGRLVKDVAVVPIRRHNMVLRCVILPQLTSTYPVSEWVFERWQYQHGLLFLVIGTVSRAAMPRITEVSFKEAWGWLSIVPGAAMRKRWTPEKPLGELVPIVPDNTTDFALTLVAFPHVKDTDTLRNSLFRFREFLESDEPSYKRVQNARRSVNLNLRRWMRNGWKTENVKYDSGKRRKYFTKYSSKELAGSASEVIRLAE